MGTGVDEGMRSAIRLMIWGPIALLAGWVLLHQFQEIRGVGSFGQHVVIETARPIKQVRYTAWQFDDELRRLAEETADIRVLEVPRQAEPLGENRFLAPVQFTSRFGGFRPTRVYHPPHLAVHVEFADDTTACRVVEIPPGRGTEPVVIRLP